MRSRLLVVGAGNVGLEIADGLLRSGRVGRLTPGIRPDERGVQAAGMPPSCHETTVGFRPLDGTGQGAVEALIAREEPDLIVNAASLIHLTNTVHRR